MKKWYWLIALGFALLWCDKTLYSQHAQDQARTAQSADQSLCQESVSEIKQNNPTVSSQTLAADKRVLSKAGPAIYEKYHKEKLDPAESTLVVCRAWVDFRVQNSHATLEAKSFVELAAQRYGGLKITSSPDGATIEVDGKKWDSDTNTQDATEVGERRIKLSKSGYEDEYGTAVVKKGDWTPFHRDLKSK